MQKIITTIKYIYINLQININNFIK